MPCKLEFWPAKNGAGPFWDVAGLGVGAPMTKEVRLELIQVQGTDGMLLTSHQKDIEVRDKRCWVKRMETWQPCY